jgi:predicted nucleic acid-binding protein
VIVVDAAAIVEVLLRTDAGDRAAAIVIENDAFAPDLLDAETFASLTRLTKRGAVAPERVDEALDDLARAVVTRVPSRALMHRAQRYTGALSGYDALYVALAAALGCPLLTADARLARAPAVGVPVTVI